MPRATIRLDGQLLGRLFVVTRAPSKNENKNTVYFCWCACGESCLVAAQSLLSGRTTSCGCIHREMMRGRYLGIGRLERKMWLRARFRARLAGLPFSITAADIKIPEICPVLGIPLHTTKKFDSRDSAPTLDRLENEKGYVRGNVFVISSRANRIKNNATPQDLMAVLNYVNGGCRG